MGRRIFRRLLITALLGAATTVVVAWTLATGVLDFMTPGRSVYRPSTETASALDVTRYDRPGGLFIHAMAGDVAGDISAQPPQPPEDVDSLAPPWTHPLLVPWGWNARPGPNDVGYLHRLVIVRGWPFHALAATLESVPNPGYWTFKSIEGFIPSESWPGFRPLMPGADPPAILPTRPLWPGFLADTAIFAAAWFLVLFLPGPARRALRRGRGLCPRCAYSLRGLPVSAACPECGPAN